MKSKRVLFTILLVFFLSVSGFAADKELVFEWDQVISNDFAGWQLWYGITQGGPYTEIIDLPYDGVSPTGTFTTDKTITVPGGVETTYYFVLLAYDDQGNESGFSNEVSATFDFESPETPLNFSVTIKVTTQ